MGFDIALTPTYRKKITVHTPNEKDGFDKSEFTAVFKRVHYATSEEGEAGDELTVDMLQTMQPLKVLEHVLVGWSGLTHNGEEVPFTEENKAALLRIVPARVALHEAFWESLVKAREKN